MTTPLTDAQIIQRLELAGASFTSGRVAEPAKRLYLLSVSDARALLAQPSVAPPAPGGDVLEAALGVLEIAPCDCPEKMRHERGEHLSGCYLFDLNIALQSTQAPTALQVWYGSMPESNGRTNWTAILHHGDVSEGFTIARSEYPQRVRYDADCVRHLLGELPDRPDLMAYDGDELTPCHLCGGAGIKAGKPCPGLNFTGTVHNAPTAAAQGQDAAPAEQPQHSVNCGIYRDGGLSVVKDNRCDCRAARAKE